MFWDPVIGSTFFGLLLYIHIEATKKQKEYPVKEVQLPSVFVRNKPILCIRFL